MDEFGRWLETGRDIRQARLDRIWHCFDVAMRKTVKARFGAGVVAGVRDRLSAGSAFSAARMVNEQCWDETTGGDRG